MDNATKMNTRELDLAKLNSMTKYPSILTYHKIDTSRGGGGLMEEVQVPLDGDLIATEKVDGTNGRIILLPWPIAKDNMYIIGSREDLLYAKNDLIFGRGDPTAYAICTALIPLAETLVPRPNGVTVLYVEVYGGDFAKPCKQYTTKKEFGTRMFDVVHIPENQFLNLMDWPLEKFSGWRERGGQPFVNETELNYISNLTRIPLTPRIPVGPVPTGIDDTLAYLRASITRSQCVLDPNAPGNPEGLVIRNSDRSRIAKLRFEDYERTIRKREQKK